MPLVINRGLRVQRRGMNTWPGAAKASSMKISTSFLVAFSGGTGTVQATFPPFI